jgi:hypothetical protein
MFSSQSCGANCFVGMMFGIRYSPKAFVGEVLVGNFLPTRHFPTFVAAKE